MSDRHGPSEPDTGGGDLRSDEPELEAALRGIVTALADQSTREGIERIVCEHLADLEGVEFAWIGAVDVPDDRVRLRAEAGVEAYLDDIEVDLGGELGGGPTGRAVSTGRIQVVDDVRSDREYGPWRERAAEYGFRSSAAVPVEHEGTLFGVLNVHFTRERGFTGRVRDSVTSLAELLGYAIAAVGWKRALLTNEVVEVEFRCRNVFDAYDLPPGDGTVRFERSIPAGGGTYIEYGSATPDMRATLEAVPNRLPRWDRMRVRDGEGDGLAFEAHRSTRPLSSIVAGWGAWLTDFVLEGGEFYLSARIPQGVAVRPIVEAVRERYPGIEFVSQRQVGESPPSTRSAERSAFEGLTQRQRTAIEAAYYAGFFEWPREATGEEVAESLEVSAPTFHQHVRKAERALLEHLLRDAPLSG
ncbi:bacterio-opsin activator domain-containing protein [Halorarum salinum]|uniref:GAF domain-containing protein n=1 Tax=Halorarum salinum TaxID=2743089 RepID=A0A7D5QEL5_9EURY|nr:bacterio-opsin activator domain-containing protein [Halobaculum salinum]QLG64200.1 GAF domain-containing protein [Halobaculum salinum]